MMVNWRAGQYWSNSEGCDDSELESKAVLE